MTQRDGGGGWVGSSLCSCPLFKGFLAVSNGAVRFKALLCASIVGSDLQMLGTMMMEALEMSGSAWKRT